jgi:hypothetical protein
MLISEHINFNNFTTGVMTYYEDFSKIVAPRINKETAKKVIFFSKKRISDKNYVQILHTPSLLYNKFCYSRTTYITHYRALVKFAKRYGMNLSYIPMSIDLDNIPVPINRKKGTIVYFGNIFSEKCKVYRQLKDTGISFDTISHYPNREEALNIVSTYEYGIGVGRCVLEMLAMGMKVIVAGRNYAGAITNDNFDIHHKSNCNSNILKSNVSNFEKDLASAEILKDCSKLYMANYINDYLSIIN